MISGCLGGWKKNHQDFSGWTQASQKFHLSNWEMQLCVGGCQLALPTVWALNMSTVL